MNKAALEAELFRQIKQMPLVVDRQSSVLGEDIMLEMVVNGNKRLGLAPKATLSFLPLQAIGDESTISKLGAAFVLGDDAAGFDVLDKILADYATVTAVTVADSGLRNDPNRIPIGSISVSVKLVVGSSEETVFQLDTARCDRLGQIWPSHLINDLYRVIMSI